MRIALVVERFLPDGGGVEQVAWQLAHGLGIAGHEVHVLAREGCAPQAPSESGRDRSRTPRLHRLGVSTLWQPLRVRLFDRRVTRFLSDSMLRFDVIHSLTRTSRQDLYRAGGGSHADFLLRTYGSAGARWRRLSPRHRVLLRAEARIFDDHTQMIQCGSERVAAELRLRFPAAAERLFVLHNGVDCARFAPGRFDAEAEMIRKQHAAPGETLWLFAGSGARRKGLDTAIRALARCRDRKAVLLVAGRDEPGRWLRMAEAEGVAARVRFLGERADMPAVYAAADALLLPTRYDAFANVCLEAAASGRAVVTSATSGVAELLTDCAHVIDDPEDVDGFANAMDALADAGARSALGEAARKRAQEHDWAEHVRRLLTRYEEIASRPRSRPELPLQWRAGDPALRARIDAWLRGDFRGEAALRSQSDHREVLRLSHEAEERDVIAKLFRSGSGPHPYRERLKGWIGTSAAEREHRALCVLHDAGVSVPTPLGLAYSAGGDALLLMSAIEGKSLYEWLTTSQGLKARTDDRVAILTALGAAVRAMHAAGFAHGDLHPGNVMVGEGACIHLLDLQRSRRDSSDARRARGDLARLDDSLSRLGVSAEERRLVVRESLGVASDAARELRGLARASQRASRAHLRARRRHCLRAGTRFDVVTIGGRSGLACRGVPAQALQSMTHATEAFIVDGCAYRTERLHPSGILDRLPRWLHASPASRLWQRAHALTEVSAHDPHGPLAFIEQRRLGFFKEAFVLYADEPADETPSCER